MNRFDRLPHIAARRQRRAPRYLTSGDWRAETLAGTFESAARAQPDQRWYFWMSGESVELSFGDLAREAFAFARRLRADASLDTDGVVAMTLPNSPAAVP